MKPTLWFGTILSITVLTLVIVYLVPSYSEFVIIRYLTGFVFVTVLPGYCLVNLLVSKEKKLDLAEQAVLSTALSFGIAGLTGLFLGVSPIGIGFNSITISLGTIVLFLAFLAFIRKVKKD